MPLSGQLIDSKLPADELDEGCEEIWERRTDDPDIRGVSARKITLGEFPYWSAGVAVAEFLREEPLEGELRQQMDAALRAVDGAETVWEDARWARSANCTNALRAPPT